VKTVRVEWKWGVVGVGVRVGHERGWNIPSAERSMHPQASLVHSLSSNRYTSIQAYIPSSIKSTKHNLARTGKCDSHEEMGSDFCLTCIQLVSKTFDNALHSGFRSVIRGISTGRKEHEQYEATIQSEERGRDDHVRGISDALFGTSRDDYGRILLVHHSLRKDMLNIDDPIEKRLKTREKRKRSSKRKHTPKD
jgi:hypothetical protein